MSGTAGEKDSGNENKNRAENGHKKFNSTTKLQRKALNVRK